MRSSIFILGLSTCLFASNVENTEMYVNDYLAQERAKDSEHTTSDAPEEGVHSTDSSS